MQRNRQLHYTPIGLIDDDPRKKNLRVHGVRVLGTTADLPHVLRDNRPDELLIAIPSAPGGVRQRIVEACRAQNVPVKTLPGLHELIAGDLNLAGQIRPVQVEDVLGREQVEVDLEAVSAYVRDKTVLVTGAGGSIGSELCRQLAAPRCGAADPGRAGRVGALRDRARAGRRARVPRGDPGARRLRRPAQDAHDLRALPPARRLPRRGVQARADARGEPARGGLEQRARHAHGRRGRDRVRRRALRADLDRQGGEPEEPARPVEGGVRVDRRVVRAARGRQRRASSRCGSATSSARPGR